MTRSQGHRAQTPADELTRNDRSILREFGENDEQRLVQQHPPNGRYKFTEATAYRSSLWVCVSTIQQLVRGGWLVRDPERRNAVAASWRAMAEFSDFR